MAWKSGWAKRQQVDIDRSKFDNTDQTHFPVTVILDSNTDFWNEMGSGDSKKVSFTKNDGTTELYAEIEQYDSGNSKAVYHISKSDWTINNDGGSDDYFYLYYDSGQSDNTTYIGDTPGSSPASDVWDSDFVGVWHLKESGDGTTDEFKDSTSNSNDGTGGGGTSTQVPTQTSAKIAKGQDFDGSDDHIDITNVTTTGSYTISLWANYDGSTDNNEFWFLDSSSGRIIFGIEDYSDEDGNYALEFYTGGWNRPNAQNISSSTWHHVAAIIDSGASEVILVKDGSTDTISVSADDIGGNVFIGANIADPTNPQSFPGMMDEFHISNTNRSAAWLKATYNSGNDSLLTFGSEEEEGGVAFIPKVTIM